MGRDYRPRDVHRSQFHSVGGNPDDIGGKGIHITCCFLTFLDVGRGEESVYPQHAEFTLARVRGGKIYRLISEFLFVSIDQSFVHIYLQLVVLRYPPSTVEHVKSRDCAHERFVVTATRDWGDTAHGIILPLTAKLITKD